MNPDPSTLRRDYKNEPLRRADMAADPLIELELWFLEAQTAKVLEPNALILGTVDAAGEVSTRTVLMKGIDARGVTFFTNYESEKGRALAEHPQASMTFLWLDLERQVHLRGTVEKVTEEESDLYFAARPYGSQIGALASLQSSVVETREVLEERFDELRAQYPEGSVIPRPECWGGYRLMPDTVEFWQGRRSRMHDRLRYRRDDGGWVVDRLCP